MSSLGVGRRIKTEADVNDLQADLNAIYQWAVNNNMQFNSDKFECLRYGRNKDILASTHYSSNSGLAIIVQQSVRDLGVIMASDIWHIQETNLECGRLSKQNVWLDPENIHHKGCNSDAHTLAVDGTLQIGLLQSTLVPNTNRRYTGTRESPQIIHQKDLRYPALELLGPTLQIEAVFT